MKYFIKYKVYRRSGNNGITEKINTTFFDCDDPEDEWFSFVGRASRPMELIDITPLFNKVTE